MKLFPIIPQNPTIDIFPISKAVINFFLGKLDTPAIIFTKNAGVKGKAIINTKLLNDNLLNLSELLFTLSFVFSLRYL